MSLYFKQKSRVLLLESVADEIGAHLEGLESHLFGVFVNGLVLPAVAEVAFEGVEADEASFPEDAKALSGPILVLVDFGEAVFKIKSLVVNLVFEGQFDKLGFGEDLFHGGTDVGIHAVVVVDVEETAGDEVVAEVFGFEVGEDDVAVAGHVDEGVVEEVGATDFDGGVVGGEVGAEVGIAEAGQVGQGGGIGVPVAAAVVFEEGQLELGVVLRGRMGGKGGGEDEDSE